MGLHKRYRSLLTGISAESELPDTQQLEEAFVAMMRRLRTQHALLPEFLLEREVQRFIEEHANILNAAFDKVTMSDLMRQRLRESDYVFSGMKTFHELKEAFPLITDEEGNVKPFHTFLNDVQKIDKTYNKDYLRSEYNFVRASSQMAGKWETFVEDGDEYNLQYRTARDHKVRPEHAAMHGITLPYSDSFWDEFFPPNGWNCRCTVVQVLKDKYPVTDHNTAIQLGREALKADKKGMFRFNSGKQQKAFPDYNPYTTRKCNTCPLAKGKGISNKVSIPNNELCRACKIVRAMAKADAKSTRLLAKNLQGKFIENPQFPHKVGITKRTLKEWTNQPFKYYEEKNRMLLCIEDVFLKSTYLGVAENHKGVPDVVQSHIFETKIKEDNALIIVREYKWGDFTLHSLSEGGELYKYIKKE